MKKLIILFVILLLETCTFAADFKSALSPEVCQELVYDRADYSYVVQVIKKLNSLWKKNILEKDSVETTIDLDEKGNLVNCHILHSSSQKDAKTVVDFVKKASPFGKVIYPPGFSTNIKGYTKIRLVFTNKNIELYSRRSFYKIPKAE